MAHGYDVVTKVIGTDGEVTVKLHPRSGFAQVASWTGLKSLDIGWALQDTLLLGKTVQLDQTGKRLEDDDNNKAKVETHTVTSHHSVHYIDSSPSP
ncbi:MAG: hypothetical protein M1827_001906 [Pycnora praestabilis]|nr:MAG: hypothetical protein M1827_001906 [Pycnora praestabilis]